MNVSHKIFLSDDPLDDSVMGCQIEIGKTYTDICLVVSKIDQLVILEHSDKEEFDKSKAQMLVKLTNMIEFLTEFKDRVEELSL